MIHQFPVPLSLPFSLKSLCFPFVPFPSISPSLLGYYPPQDQLYGVWGSKRCSVSSPSGARKRILTDAYRLYRSQNVPGGSIFHLSPNISDDAKRVILPRFRCPSINKKYKKLKKDRRAKWVVGRPRSSGARTKPGW